MQGRAEASWRVAREMEMHGKEFIFLKNLIEEEKLMAASCAHSTPDNRSPRN